MSAANGHGGPGGGAAVARPVALVRYRPGVVGETARTVHVVPLPTDEQAGAVGTVCGAVLLLDDIETVTPGQGMPCTVCVISHMAGTPAAGEPPAGTDAGGLAAGGACYQQWGWPVTLHRDQVRLSLHRNVSALPWTPQVHQVTGVLLLPPTVTPRGPITWARPPRADSLQLFREIDLFGALRTALDASRPGDPPPGGDHLPT